MRLLLNSSICLVLLLCSLSSAQLTFTSARCATGDARLARKDIRALSTEELTTYITAVKGLMNRASTNSRSEYDNFVNVHITNQATIHGFPNFFPWHRIYLRHFERLLQRNYPTCTVPYWDWSADSQAPERSVVFGANFFGGNGAGSNRCVSTGQFNTWRPFYPRMHCLTRSFNGGTRITAFHSTEVLNADISRSTTYAALRNAIEYNSHAVVHTNIGRDFAQMISPNDPLFWLHHAMVDRIWYTWQWTVRNWRDYSGNNSNRSPARLTDVLRPFVETVEQALDPYYLCYYYQAYTPPTVTQTSTLQRRQLYKKSTKKIAKKTAKKKSQKGGKKEGKKYYYNRSSLKSSDLKDIFLKKSRSDAVTYVAPGDRQTLIKLRTPDPIPSDWLLRNNLNVTEARRMEREYAKLYASINSIPNYVSPCAILAHPEVVKSITSEESTLKAQVNDVDVELNLNGRTGDEAVDFVYGTVDYATLNAASPEGDPLTQLKSVIGEIRIGPLSDSPSVPNVPRPISSRTNL